MENIETLLAAVAQTQGFDDEERGSEHSKSPAVIPADTPPNATADVTPPASKEVAPAAVLDICAGGKRKRGRPPKGQRLRVNPRPPKRNKAVEEEEEEEEEDVCFICFDGGSLVLCDRKGCPKAYHPACIKRDEAFFRSKTKWNCGWHICIVCRKASYYMCYTCTYSLCKGCIKDTDYARVRGNKGFCSTCMKTIMLIENKDHANNEVGNCIDFDDQTSWEYLFKVYWVILKEKLSLTLNDLTRANKTRKGMTAGSYIPPRSILMPTAVNVEVPKGLTAGNYIPPRSILMPTAVNVEVPVTDSSTDPLELKKPQLEHNLPLPSDSNNMEKLNNRFEGDGPAKPSVEEIMQETGIEKATDEPGMDNDQDKLNSTKDTDKSCTSKDKNGEESEKPEADHITEWATKNLLGFVAHMKDGDVSAMSIFEVQTLLLDYINRNNLWDPRRKSQIKCDPRLKSIFGKTRVGHVEMLKLLESHILIKGDCQNNSSIPAGFVSSVRSDREADESEEDNKSSDDSKKGKEESPTQAQVIMNEKTDLGESFSSEKYANQENITNLTTDSTNDHYMQRSELETSTPTASVGNSPSPNVTDIEKLWHYRDPDGKIHGPFSMLQLRECSTTGLYAPDMRIWSNHEQYDSVFLTDALNGRFHGASDSSNSGSREEEGATGNINTISEGINVSYEDIRNVDTPCNDASVSSANDAGAVVGADRSNSWPRCWDFLKDNSNNADVNNDVQAHNLLPPSRLEEKHEALRDCGQESENLHHHDSRHGEEEINSTGSAQNPISSGCEAPVVLPAEEQVRSFNIDLSSNDVGLSKSLVSNKQVDNMSILDFPSPAGPNTDSPAQHTGFLELLGPASRSDDQDHHTSETNPGFVNLPIQISEMVDELCELPFTFSLKPPEAATSAPELPSPPTNPPPSMPGWLASANEPIEFDALGEESVSDLLAEVDAMESQGAPHSPSAAIKFAREFLEDCRDDCFSSIEEFGSKNDALTRPDPVSAASSEGETNAAPPGAGVAGPSSAPPPDICVDPGWGAVQGHINLVTVQGNVNLVLGGPAGWGTGLGSGWVSPGLGHGPVGAGSLPWDGQRKYQGGWERFGSPREWAGGYQGGRAPWGRGMGGYPRSLPKGQRVCKFYESGHCKKGAFCDYLHHP
ncbi:Zinc finger CCCH domain-containing protein 44 [Striga hermonthica]|uniref:Zinc finger CCCH domain-containing protein 44 n=1 Tax=Striga hermonthica TaxID=68872 RepID=A0A9N7NZ17_STRHE|nr:Zinc finger CCCH domain-containing protein 44 [Striga hermonthica]